VRVGMIGLSINVEKQPKISFLEQTADSRTWTSTC
jgi:hypothetical protein